MNSGVHIESPADDGDGNCGDGDDDIVDENQYLLKHGPCSSPSFNS